MGEAGQFWDAIGLLPGSASTSQVQEMKQQAAGKIFTDASEGLYFKGLDRQNSYNDGRLQAGQAQLLYPWQYQMQGPLAVDKMKQDMALQKQKMDLFASLLGGSNTNGTVDYGSIAGLLGDARNLRNSTFANGSLGRTEAGYGSQGLAGVQSRLGDLSTLQGNGMSALQDMGRSRMQNDYLSGLRDMRSMTSDRSLPAETALAMKGDLLKQKLRSGRDLQQNLIANEGARQGDVLSRLAGVIGQDQSSRLAQDSLNTGLAYQEALNRLGNPEMAAQMKLQADQANQQRFSQILGMMGGI